MKRYANYHKHDHISNIYTPDTPFKCEDYLKRIKELGYNAYWTTNHGTGGDIFEARKLCDEYGIKCYYGVEAYIVKNALEKDKSNFHIVILPRTNEARKDLNEIISKANIEGFYSKPRISVTDLLALPLENYFITSACVQGIANDVENLFLPLAHHFGKNFFVEIQAHNCEKQIKHNELCKLLAEKYGLQYVAATDSHYIYPQDSIVRSEFLKGKGIKYEDESGMVLDYPDYDTLFERFRKQGVFNEDEIKSALKNTLVFETCEEIALDKEIKMPTIFPNMSVDEKHEELKRHIITKFAQICKDENITGETLKTYKEAIRYEFDIIEKTKEINTVDYFLLNERIVELATQKYGGILTRSGRGSCGSFLINRILEITQIDRLTSPITLYPERFISTARLLENRSMPDIDFNVAEQEPFVKATKELLGEKSIYPMVAYGTMQLSEAFRNVCRAKGMEFAKFNNVAKNIETYEDNAEWKPIIDEAKGQLETVVSVSPHPCAFALDNKNLQREYGVIRVNDVLCVMITSEEADFWKILKDDFLVVKVWAIIADTFKMIGRPILTVKELLERVDIKIGQGKQVWALIGNGLTTTINQLDSDYATALVKQYQPKNIRELAMFVAALRPSFDAWRDSFLSRRYYTTGVPKLDEVLSETNGRIIFQENLMTYFQWLGVSPSEAIDLIKKISKKKIKESDFKKLEKRLKAEWEKQVGSADGFTETWEMVQSCMAYGFAAPHALATAIDALYGAYLKCTYPYQYYTVALGYYEDDLVRTRKLVSELKHFDIKLEDIKFRKSTDKYTFDKKERKIYKSIPSVKHLNIQIAKDLYVLRDFKGSFVDLLYEIKLNTSINSKQLDILIKADYFSEYGDPNALLYAVAVFEKYYKAKQIKKSEIKNLNLFRECSEAETENLFKGIDNIKLISNILKTTVIPRTTPTEKAKYQIEVLGYSNVVDKTQDVSVNIVQEVETNGYGTTRITLYNLAYGVSKALKADKKFFAKTPLIIGDVVVCVFGEKNNGHYDENHIWKPDGTKYTYLKCWKKIKEEN